MGNNQSTSAAQTALFVSLKPELQGCEWATEDSSITKKAIKYSVKNRETVAHKGFGNWVALLSRKSHSLVMESVFSHALFKSDGRRHNQGPERAQFYWASRVLKLHIKDP